MYTIKNNQYQITKIIENNKVTIIKSIDMIETIEITIIRKSNDWYNIIIVENDNLFSTENNIHYIQKCINEYFFQKIVIYQYLIVIKE